MSPAPIDFQQIQAIQGAGADVAPSCVPRGRYRPFHPGASRRWRFGPTTASVGSAYQTCAPQVLVVSPGICQPTPPTDDASVETIAQGVSKGLQGAPLLIARPAPWNEPDYRGVEVPQTASVVLSTLAATSGQVLEVQAALAGYLGTASYPVAAVVATPGAPAAVLTFRPQDSYRAYEFSVSCQDAEALYLVQWIVTVNGYIHSGPFSLVDGRARLAVKCKRGDTVAVLALLASGDAFTVGLIVKLSGWQYPTLTSVDGTYTKVLRQSPSWPRKD